VALAELGRQEGRALLDAGLSQHRERALPGRSTRRQESAQRVAGTRRAQRTHRPASAPPGACPGAPHPCAALADAWPHQDGAPALDARDQGAAAALAEARLRKEQAVEALLQTALLRIDEGYAEVGRGRAATGTVPRAHADAPAPPRSMGRCTWRSGWAC
jgi:hypothetical protein